MYDAWGVCYTIVLDDDATDIANLNPFRYRSYYLDTGLNLYYLKTRYYDPEICRFITIDDILYLSLDTINGLNLYAYCVNNPIVYYDPSGYWVETVFDLFSLGISIIEVVINPGNPLAWAGLGGDALDLIPFVTGVGESVKGVRVVAKGADLADDARDAAKVMKVSDFAKDTLDTVTFVKATDMVDDFADNGVKLKIVGNSTDYHSFTSSNHVDGTKLHTLFKDNGSRIDGTKLRVDGFDPITKTIYELKPYNKRNIRYGVKQIIKYDDALGGGYRKIIVLY